MKTISEQIPENMPEWAKDSMERGTLFQDVFKRIERLESALKSLARWEDGEPCFCSFLIGYPINDHSDLCKQIRKLLEGE